MLQRRCVRAARALEAGAVIERSDLEVLRPAPADAVPPQSLDLVVGRTLARDLVAGEHLAWEDLA